MVPVGYTSGPGPSGLESWGSNLASLTPLPAHRLVLSANRSPLTSPGPSLSLASSRGCCFYSSPPNWSSCCSQNGLGKHHLMAPRCSDEAV